jgi:putative membrane protein
MHGFEGMGIEMGWSWLIGFLVVVIIVWAITKKGINTSKNPSVNEKKSAIEILKGRYSKGEINKEEFEKQKNILGS